MDMKPVNSNSWQQESLANYIRIYILERVISTSFSQGFLMKFFGRQSKSCIIGLLLCIDLPVDNNELTKTKIYIYIN